MAQPSLVSTRPLQRHQSQIARDLLATLKPICVPDEQHEGQCRQRTHSGMRLQASRRRTITRCSTAHHQDVQVVPRANRTFSTARNPIPSASSNTNAPPAFAPSPPWRFSALAAALGGNTYSAIPADSAPSLAPLPLKGSATVSCLVS